MPAQKTKVDVTKKLGSKLNGAIKGHAKDETKIGGFIRLPGGLNGVAKLSEVTFGEHKDGDNKGKLFCRLAAVVLTPDKAPDGTPVKGLQTSQVFPLYETKSKTSGEVTSFDDNVGSLLNEFRKLGVDTSEMSDGSEIEAVAETLTESKPCFRYSTTETAANGKFKARVWENWHGNKGLEDYQEEEGSSVEDNTEEAADDDEGESEPENSSESSTESDEAEESDGTPTEDDGLDELAALATKGGKAGTAAGKKIVAQAALFDISEEECTNADSWDIVVGMIREKAAEGGEESPEEDDDCPYKVDEVYKFQPLDPKTKKPMVNAKTKKPQFVEVVISAVDKEAETVELINNDDKKTKYKNVAWGKLKEI